MSAKHRQKGKVTKDSITLLPCFYFVEVPILASSAVSLYFLELTDVFKPVHSGYNCDDRSLSLPYIEPTHEVVPVLMLLCLSFAGPTAMILISEAILYCCLSIRRNRHQMEVNINAAGCYFNSYIRRAVRFVGVHVFGLCATALITDIIQLSTGYHAPYFLTICKPNCTVLNTACDENTFIMDNICSGADPSIINSGRKSFPSQHATLAAFAAVYISMYFNAILNDSSKLLKPTLVFSFIICAIICGLTRIIQYKNHAIDVYLGFLIGGGIAMYLGLYAVGNFQPGEDIAGQQPPPWSLTDIREETSQHLPMKNGSISDGIASHSESILSRNPRNHNSSKRASADVEVINSRSPMDKAHMVTFCNTLPRVHTAVRDEATHRNATIHASMDTIHSKKLLSQWKSKNEGRKLSLQVMEIEEDSFPPGSIEMQSSSEPSRVGVHGDQLGPASQYMKLASSSAQSANNSHSIDEGMKVIIQSRPGSSQLVYIPEEMQENINNSPKDGSVSSKWQVVTEKSEICKTDSQPRIMQVIALSKQQGMFQTSSNSSNGMAAIRYETPTKQETTSIVRVGAHPENNQPTVPAPSINGSSSWKWKSQETSSLRQSCELNDTNRDSASSEGIKDGNGSKNEKKGTVDAGGEHIHHLGMATVQVTSVEKSDVPSESMPVTFSRDSTLRRKGNIILIPERGNSLESTRSIFYKGISPTPPLQE